MSQGAEHLSVKRSALSVERSGAAAPATQLAFDWLVPVKPFFRVSEVAGRMDLSSTKVEELFAEKCHRYPAGKSAAQKRAQRRELAAAEGRTLAHERERTAMRIPRAFFIAALVTSARYTAEEKVAAIGSCFADCSRPELLLLQQQLSAELRRSA